MLSEQVRTNGFAYRLTNTSKTVSELLRDGRGLVLRNALLDTAAGRPEVPEYLRAQGDPGSYLVQARGAINRMFREDLMAAGAEVVSYVPNNAVLVRASAAQVRKVEASAQVQAVLPFEPYYKLDAALLAVAVERKLSPFEKLNVVAFPRATERVRKAIRDLGGEVVGEAERTPFGDNVVAKIPARSVAALAQVPEVQLVGVRGERRMMNDLARVRTRVSTNTVTMPPSSHYQGLGGSNVLVAIIDTGVDASHPDLQGRILNVTNDRPIGHGTHVAGTILGNGAQSGTVGGYALQGSVTGAVFSGMAPYATGWVHRLDIGTDIELQERTALAGARISNNSWAYESGFANDYDIFAASYDAAVRDSLNGVTGQQPLTYVFSAGNSGGGGDNGFGGARGSVLSPATGKNVITVGAVESLRRITNLVWKCDTNGCFTNAPWFGSTDSSNQIAGFSSRGNVGIGREGD